MSEFPKNNKFSKHTKQELKKTLQKTVNHMDKGGTGVIMLIRAKKDPTFKLNKHAKQKIDGYTCMTGEPQDIGHATQYIINKLYPENRRQYIYSSIFQIITADIQTTAINTLLDLPITQLKKIKKDKEKDDSQITKQIEAARKKVDKKEEEEPEIVKPHSHAVT